MASLTGQSVASSYEQLLHVDRDGGGNGTTLVDIKDGDNGTTFALQLATDKINVTGRLGVGTTSPEADIAFEPDVYTTANQGIRWQDPVVTTDAIVQGVRQASNVGIGVLIGANSQVDTSGGISRFNTSDESSFISVDPRGDLYFGTGGTGANPSTRMHIDSAGTITSPANPAFQVQNSADHNNIAVGSAYIDKTFDTEIFDQGSNFASNVFTAPVTGKYLLISKLAFQSADATDAVLYNLIVTSNRTYSTIGGGGLDADTTINLDVCVVADMDANDTAKVQYRQIGGAAQADVVTSSFFAGYLLG